MVRLRAVSTLSSTTSTRNDRPAARVLSTCGNAAASAFGTTTGRRTTNSLPDPSLLWASIRPPCISTSWWASARPMPRPPCERSSERAPCVNRSKMLGKASSAMPTPLSRTRITHSSSSWPTVTQMWPPSPVYLTALVSRFTTTCSSLAASPFTEIGSSGMATVSSCLCVVISGRAVSIACDTTEPAVITSCRSCTRPVVMRATSSRSSTMCRSCPTCRSMMPTACCWIGLSRPCSRNRSTALRIGASGLRSS